MHAKTIEILDIFTQINRIPRCSKNEGRIAAWLLAWAEANGFETAGDPAGNLVVRVPATPGWEAAPVIVLQGHMDMVCEKTPDSTHDFARDPIVTRVQGDWVTADRTTLGADNGIALALAMALATDAGTAHPPLELLFTVDEETGLNGAKAIEAGFFQGRVFLNIDSETEGVFTVGCAGGRDSRILLPLNLEPAQGLDPLRVSVGGLRGGHSGIDIHKQRANANVLLARVLQAVSQKIPLRLAAIHGGSAHNAIPRDAEAVILCSGKHRDPAAAVTAGFQDTAAQEFSGVENGIRIAAAPSDPAETGALSEADSVRVVRLLLALPHGVAGLSRDMPGLVETSSNLATLRVKDGTLHVLTSQRSSSGSRLDEISGKVRAVAALAGARVEVENPYPAWPPDMDSPLLARCRKVYTDLFGKAPVVEAIHAGLECAVIGATFPGVDMISFGPDLENPHSPDERLNIPSIERVWRFTRALLASYRP